MWKKSKKVLDIQENGCYYKQADAWEMKVLNAEQKIKKVVDKHETLWYNIKAVAREQTIKWTTYLLSRAIWRSTQAGRRGSPGKGVGR